jgi:ABC-type amino acid transport system permease subunit
MVCFRDDAIACQLVMIGLSHFWIFGGTILTQKQQAFGPFSIVMIFLLISLIGCIIMTASNTDVQKRTTPEEIQGDMNLGF